jgi:hypothetical protein
MTSTFSTSGCSSASWSTPSPTIPVTPVIIAFIFIRNFVNKPVIISIQKIQIFFKTAIAERKFPIRTNAPAFR